MQTYCVEVFVLVLLCVVAMSTQHSLPAKTISSSHSLPPSYARSLSLFFSGKQDGIRVADNMAGISKSLRVRRSLHALRLHPETPVSQR